MQNVVRYKPWVRWKDLQDQMTQLFEGNLVERNGDASNISTSQWSPNVDIREAKDRYTIYADIPGVDPKDIEVSLEGNILTIKGERNIEARTEQDSYTRTERFSGTFYRRFALPDDVDNTKVQAKGRHGVLVIQIPKKETNIPKKIEVDVEVDS
jgi:HSP20 family protein